MTKARSTQMPSTDTALMQPQEAQQTTVHIGRGINVPMYANKKSEAFAHGPWERIQNAFKMDEVVRNLIPFYERHGYSDVLCEIDRLKPSSELVLALLLRRKGERSTIASRNAKSKLESNRLDQLKEEATLEYLRVRGKKSKDDFSHDFSLELETRKAKALRRLNLSKHRLEEEKTRQAQGGAQLRRKPENVKKLAELQQKVDAAEVTVRFKVYKPSTIRDVWLKGL